MVAASHDDQQDQRHVNLSTLAPATKQILQSSDGIISYYKLLIAVAKKMNSMQTQLYQLVYSLFIQYTYNIHIIIIQMDIDGAFQRCPVLPWHSSGSLHQASRFLKAPQSKLRKCCKSFQALQNWQQKTQAI